MTPEFRVWDPYEERMITKGIVICDGEMYEDWRDFEDGVPLMNINYCEQYTGLKDKNGNNIFEGDIVHCENDYQGTDYTGKVMFFNGGFCVWTGGFRNYVWDDMIPEIIGNIHENPELLEVDDEL